MRLRLLPLFALAACSSTIVTPTDAGAGLDALVADGGGGDGDVDGMPPPIVDAAADGAGVVALTVTFLGTGGGSVSLGGGDSCVSSCERAYPSGASVTLTAIPADNSIFSGWGGTWCSGTAPCTVQMDRAKEVMATFDQAGTTVQLQVSSTGPGDFHVDPAGTTCGPGCSTYAAGSRVTITAQPDAGFSVESWEGGGCSGGATCALTLTQDASVVIHFCPYNYVAAPDGNDTNAGTCAAPYRTLTKALGVAVSGKLVGVRPGTYVAASGEVFPLRVPASVSVLGDEDHKGNGAIKTVVQGSGAVGATGRSATFVAGAGATIAGLAITADGANGDGILVDAGASGVTVRNNTLAGSTKDGLELFGAGTTGHVITGNVITMNAGVGIDFSGGGALSKVEGNVVRQNDVGVATVGLGVDLGGGSAGSAGLNVLSCNSTADVELQDTDGVAAEGNAWDHVPPTSGCATQGTDICAVRATLAPTDVAKAAQACN